jgi:hypothetical protein
MKPQVPPELFLRSYDSNRRFASYWTQIESVLKLQCPPLLEIGIGNQTVSDYLRKRHTAVITLDLDGHLHPDVTGSVSDLPFQDNSFGTVMACQVLEHLPFDYFAICLREMARVSRCYAVISLPHAGRVWQYQVHLPGYGPVRKLLELNWWRRPQLPVEQETHFWEIEILGYSRSRIEGVIEESGWLILERRRVWEFPYHQFYILGKPTGAEVV